MRRRLSSASLALALSTLAACEYDGGVAPAVQPRIVVNAVLNPAVAEEVLLVERTLTAGRHCEVAPPAPGGGGVLRALPTCASDSADPIVAAGGEPISGAEVVVYGPAGDSAVAIEDLVRRGDGKGAGVYRFLNAAVDASRRLGDQASLGVVPGARYALRVTTPLGTARGTTTLPDAPVAGTPTTPVAFNVERGDFVQRVAVAATGAAGYLVVIDEPVGRARWLYDAPVALSAFSASLVATSITAPGVDSRVNVDLNPGLPSEGRVSAVDVNYARALRASGGEDPFSSENPGSSIDGGVGVFGSLVPLTVLRLDVVSYIDEPIEGRYLLVDGPAEAPRELRLYAYRSRLTGGFQPSDAATAALLGNRGVDPPVRLEFYGDRFAGERVGVFSGRYDSGELRGSFLAAGQTVSVPVSYRKTP